MNQNNRYSKVHKCDERARQNGEMMQIVGYITVTESLKNAKKSRERTFHSAQMQITICTLYNVNNLSNRKTMG